MCLQVISESQIRFIQPMRTRNVYTWDVGSLGRVLELSLESTRPLDTISSLLQRVIDQGQSHKNGFGWIDGCA